MTKAYIKVGLIVASNLETAALDKPTLLLARIPYIYYLVQFKKDQTEF